MAKPPRECDENASEDDVRTAINNALLDACRTDDIANLKRLVAEGADPNATIGAFTIVGWAAVLRKYDIVRYFMGLESDVEKGFRGRGNSVFGRLLCAFGVPCGPAVAHDEGLYRVMDKLVEETVEIVSQRRDGGGLEEELLLPEPMDTPVLHVLANHGNVRVLQMLLDIGADPNVRCAKTKYTAFEIACRTPHRWEFALALLQSPKFNFRAIVDNIHVQQCPLMHYCAMHIQDFSEAAGAVLKLLHEKDPSAIMTPNAKGKLPIAVAHNKEAKAWMKKELLGPQKPTPKKGRKAK